MNEEVTHDMEPQSFLSSTISPRSHQWALLQEDIQRFYMIENNSLPTTMAAFSERLGFNACPRTWKSKLKGWGFVKNIPKIEMKRIIATASKRSRDEEHIAASIEYNGYTISSEKLKNAKRRKVFRECDNGRAANEIPRNIGCWTSTTKDVLTPPEENMASLPSNRRTEVDVTFDDRPASPDYILSSTRRIVRGSASIPRCWLPQPGDLIDFLTSWMLIHSVGTKEILDTLTNFINTGKYISILRSVPRVEVVMAKTMEELMVEMSAILAKFVEKVLTDFVTMFTHVRTNMVVELMDKVMGKVMEKITDKIVDTVLAEILNNLSDITASFAAIVIHKAWADIRPTIGAKTTVTIEAIIGYYSRQGRIVQYDKPRLLAWVNDPLNSMTKSNHNRPQIPASTHLSSFSSPAIFFATYHREKPTQSWGRRVPIKPQRDIYDVDTPMIREAPGITNMIEIEDSEDETTYAANDMDRLSDGMEILSVHNNPSTIDSTTLTTQSSRRGVTYPESVITGISDGEFMIP